MKSVKWQGAVVGEEAVSFPGGAGHKLAGVLQHPPEGTALRGAAVHAHCFTCGKDIAAARGIARGLAARGDCGPAL